MVVALERERMSAARLNSLSLLVSVVGLALAVPPGGASEAWGEGKGGTQAEEPRRSIEAVRTPLKPRIDGCLEDSVWQALTFQGNFVQREPWEGAAASERTEVGILYDDDNLYLGVKCYDSAPGRVVAREMLRDTQLDDDDNFEVVIDSYRDRRSGFYFVVNPHGARRDAVFSNEGRNFNAAWDGIWRCAAEINHLGWFAEVAIPWKTLRFAKQDTQVWGINFARTIRRKNEYVYWQPVPRDVGWVGLFRLSQAGTLHGLTRLQGGGAMDIKPYLAGGLQRDMQTGFSTLGKGAVGLDAKVLVSPNLVVDFTVNPDFAQVEADREQVNLTRFSLYLPEKRDFFLEGGDVFAFGSGRGHGGGNVELFYSRRIGLVQGTAIPILGGAKVVGKVKDYQVGALNVVTERSRTNDGEVVPATNFAVLRLRRDLMSRASLGVLLTSKQELDAAGYGHAFGFDGVFPLTDYFTVSGWFAGELDSHTEAPWHKALARRTAAELSARYHSDLWSFGGTFQDVGGAFDPAMGFVRRRDFRRSQLSVEYSPRPALPSVVRQFSYHADADWRTDHAGRLLDSSVGASFGLRFQNSARVRLGVEREYEWLPEDWEVRPGFLVPKGAYSGLDAHAEATSDRGRGLSGSVDVHVGDYYTGQSLQVGTGAEVTSIARVKLMLNYHHNFVSMAGKHFSTNTVGMRLFYFFSTELFCKVYIQWNDDRLSYEGRHRLISNFLLRWTYSPGSDLYLVVNDARLLGPSGHEISNRTVMLKVTRFLRT